MKGQDGVDIITRKHVDASWWRLPFAYLGECGGPDSLPKPSPSSTPLRRIRTALVISVKDALQLQDLSKLRLSCAVSR
jgi:hypothetical protein